MNLGKQFKEGLITNNPVLVQVLGMCSTMAISTSFFNGLGMGVAVLVILTLSNIIISAIRKIVPDKIRIAMFIVVIAGFVTMVDLMIQAFLPDLSKSLGVFIPLIVVNCIILARAEAFASKNPVLPSAVDGLAMGLGFTFALFLLASLREILGNGSWFGITLLPAEIRMAVFTMPAGAFITLGILIAVVQKLRYTSESRARLRALNEKGREGDQA